MARKARQMRGAPRGIAARQAHRTRPPERLGRVKRPKVVSDDSREHRSVTHFAESEPPQLHHHGVNPTHLRPGNARDLTPFQAFRMWLNTMMFRYPARLTLVIFLILIALTTAGLMIPNASYGEGSTDLTDAFFTAVSAVTVTGLTVVDTAQHWTMFGQVVISIGIALGGLGVMTMASLLALVVSRRLGLTQKLMTAEDTRGRLSDAGTLVIGVIVTTVVAEVVLFLTILPSFLDHGHNPGEATWNAFFMANSAFNNAGFVSMNEGLAAYVGSWGVLIPLTLATIVGAIGFPVITDLRRNWKKPERWSLHTKMTLTTYFAVAAISGVMVAMLEWGNPATLGGLPLPDKILNSLMATFNPRSSGMSAVDVGQMTPATWLITDLSMFIGGGSGSHAGGIKVTTFAVLMTAAWAEARGRKDVETFNRRIPSGTVRQAVAVLLGSVLLLITVALLLTLMTPFSLDRILFEVVSAFGTVGLSTGITPDLPDPARVLISVLMVVGRVGPMTLATALALRQEHSLVRMPEERPIVG